MTLYGLNHFFCSLLARLTSLEERGVIFLLDDEGELTIRIPQGRLTEPGARERLKQSKPDLLAIVRLREGLCIHCGMDRARHPQRKAVAENWIAETQTVVSADCSALGVYPTYCLSCWESRAFWRDVCVRKPNDARSKKETTGDADKGSRQSVRLPGLTAPERTGDRGGTGLESPRRWFD